MEVNFDLLVSGCNTRCRHCYVNGGPGKNMPIELALLCIHRLDELAALLPFPASFTLDNEPMNHPALSEILRASVSARHIRHYHHGMTTGIALMGRPDREAVVQTYLDCGLEDFGITLHGSEAHHDEIVCRRGAYRTALEAAAFLQATGAKLNVSLLFNRYFREDAAELDGVLARLRPAFVYFAVPNYTPHARMRAYEPYRGTLEELRALSPYLDRWGQDSAALLRAAEQSRPAAVAKQLAQGLSLRALFREEQDELYCTVHPDGLLYLGNTGAETALLGDLRILDLAEVTEAICRAPGNRDYGAFYAEASLPEDEALRRALERLPGDLLYSDPASVIYRGLEELSVPTRILA